jgi:putative transposase
MLFYLGMINHKKVHRIMRLHRHPRVEHRKSMVASPNQRWATTSPPWAGGGPAATLRHHPRRSSRTHLASRQRLCLRLTSLPCPRGRLRPYAGEYSALYTPEQNGLCERFIRTFKEECAWQHRFDNLTALTTSPPDERR